jgi:hypothetical protein
MNPQTSPEKSKSLKDKKVDKTSEQMKVDA